VGFNLFVLEGMTKRNIAYIAKAALPMFCAMVLAVLLIYLFPQLVLWLPTVSKV
jgi:C4-dicarboxylate transporter, DctM subunit